MSDIKITNIDNFAKLKEDKIGINFLKPLEEINKETEEYRLKIQDHQIRKNNQEYAMKSDIYRWVKKIINCYLFFVFCIIAFKAFSLNFGLTAPEIIAILTSTTATIIGLPYLIVSSLFSKSDYPKSDKASPIIDRKIKND